MKKFALAFFTAAAVLAFSLGCALVCPQRGFADQNAPKDDEIVKKDANGNPVELKTKAGFHIAYMGTFRVADGEEKPANDVVSVFMVMADRDMQLWTDTGSGIDTKTHKFNYRNNNWCHIAGNNARQTDILEGLWMRVEFFHVLPLDIFGELPRVGRFDHFTFAEAGKGETMTKLTYRKIRVQPASALKELEPALAAIEEGDEEEIEVPTASKPRATAKENSNKPKPDEGQPKTEPAKPEAKTAEPETLTEPKPAEKKNAYKTWFGPVQVTESNRNNLALVLGLKNGTITYSPASSGKTARLDLKDVTIENLFTERYDTSPHPASYHWWSYAAVYSEEDLTVNVSGMNLIDTSGFSVKGANLFGIHSRGNLTIQGDGGLIVHCGETTNNNSLDYRGSVALYAEKVLTARGEVNLLAEGGKGEHGSTGIRGSKGIRVEGSASVIASGGFSPYNSFGCWEGPVEVFGGSLMMIGSTRALEGTLALNEGFSAVTNTEVPEAEDSKAESAETLAPGTYSEEIAKFKYIDVATMAVPESSPKLKPEPNPEPTPPAKPVKPEPQPEPKQEPQQEPPAPKVEPKRELTANRSENFANSLWSAGTQEAVEAAVKAGANVNAANVYGNTALLIAVAQREPDLAAINALIKAGANLNEGDAFGCTALIRSVKRSDPKLEVIVALLDAGADVTVKDQWGHTAADYAGKNRNLKDTDILKRLESARK